MPAPLYACIDLGGTKIAAALADAGGNLLFTRTVPTEAHLGPDAVLHRLAGVVRDLEAEAGQPAVSLGMGLPCLVDVPHGISRFCPNMETQWRNIPVAATLRELLGVPVGLLNDARAATLGELIYGHGKAEPGRPGVQTMVMFTLGTGIGGGVVIDGKLRLGSHSAAGELGHQTVQADGPLCGCGNRGCVEAIASGPAIAAQGRRLAELGQAPVLRELLETRGGSVHPGLMAEAAAKGDQAVAEVFRSAGEYLGIAASNMITALHPELVVFGGGMAALGDLLLAPIRQTILHRVRMLPPETVRVERSLLGSQAGLLGALVIAKQAAA